MSDAMVPADLYQTLSANFGLAEFRPGQEDVVRDIIAGKDVLVVMPTGHGKSLCYQLPALMLPGATLVVSPLIALMSDQVSALQRRNIPAAFVNSSISVQEQTSILASLRRGELKLLYIAPERFSSERFVNALQGVNVSLFVVDEAHCVTQWGHDFRPDYLKLAAARRLAGNPRMAAFTATATPDVRREISAGLALASPSEFVVGFDRENLILDVLVCPGQQAKYDALEDALAENGMPAIVYAATRKNAEKVAGVLGRPGRPCLVYHAGMPEVDRERVQQAFMRGDAPLVVATVAFGMGVDKRDIRLVAHFDVPGSIESYYQEVGRAGRDGYPCRGMLLFNYADTRTQEFFIEGSNPSQTLIQGVYDLIWRESPDALPIESPVSMLANRLGLKNDMAIHSALSILDRHGLIDRIATVDESGMRRSRARAVRPVPPKRATIPIDWAALARKKSWDMMRLKRIIAYAYNTKFCRRGLILDYFTGKRLQYKCGSCDVCRPESRRASPQPRFDVNRASASTASESRAARPKRAKSRRAAPSDPAGSPSAAQKPAEPPLTAAESARFERLRQLRKSLASSERVPPYIVAHDSVLRAFARLRPQTTSELGAIRGVGPHTTAKYGAQFLEILKTP